MMFTESQRTWVLTAQLKMRPWFPELAPNMQLVQERPEAVALAGQPFALV